MSNTQTISCVTLPAKISCIPSAIVEEGNIATVSCVDWEAIPPYPPGQSGTCLFQQGATDVSMIDWLLINTLSDSYNWAALTLGHYHGGCAGNDIRIIWAGGGTWDDAYDNVVYAEYATQAPSQGWGASLTLARFHLAACASSLYAYFCGGAEIASDCFNRVDRCSIGILAVMTNYSGLLEGKRNLPFGFSGPTSSHVGGGYCPAAGGYLSLMETIRPVFGVAWGGLTVGRSISHGSLCNATRAICAGGRDAVGWLDVMDYHAPGGTGSTWADFGNLSAASGYITGACNPTKGVFIGGSPTRPMQIGYVEIATLSDEMNFGDLSGGNTYAAKASSNAHGGIT